jgi:glycerol uptake facilitator-like aquaporin
MVPYLLEFIGSILFVYVILSTNNPLAIGGTLALIGILIGSTTGGHVNPAVSIVMASAGKLPIDDLLPYCIAQIMGGLVALEFVRRQRQTE